MRARGECVCCDLKCVCVCVCVCVLTVLRCSLPALAATKGVDHKTTLMDYLTSMVEKKDPDLLNFHEDLNCLAEARRFVHTPS